MKDSARKSTAVRAPVVSVQIPLPVLESLQAAQGDLFALFVDTGREVLRAMMEQDRVALCGPKGKRLPERAAVRAGSTRSEVNFPHLDGHPRRRDNAPGVIHAEAEEAGVHGGVQAGGGTAL